MHRPLRSAGLLALLLLWATSPAMAATAEAARYGLGEPEPLDSTGDQPPAAALAASPALAPASPKVEKADQPFRIRLAGAPRPSSPVATGSSSPAGLRYHPADH